MFNSKNITQMLKGICESDESSADNIDLDSAIDDTEYLMQNIPDVASDDAEKLGESVNVENVRIKLANNNFYIEFAELYALMESTNRTAAMAMDAILERYETEAPITSKNFFITVPRAMFEEVISFAESGDQRAMNELHASSNALRAIVNSGMPIRKL